MERTKEISGISVRVTTRKTVLDTWVGEAEFSLAPHTGIVIAEMSGAEEGLLKQYITEEEAERAAFQLAERRIMASLATRGIAPR
jgi:hypothetical protein